MVRGPLSFGTLFDKSEYSFLYLLRACAMFNKPVKYTVERNEIISH